MNEDHTHTKRSPKALVFFGMIVIILLGIGVLMFFRQPQTQSGENVIVTLTEDGFQPEKITVKNGTTVIFRSTTGEFYWPASNLHPSHEIYSEFDPKEPVAKDETWSFRFDKAGEWKYHDHIAPYYTGTVTVTE